MNGLKCIYCQRPAGTKEHIFATQFIKVLGEDPRGLRKPLRLYVPQPEGQLQVGGKRTKKGHYTLEYTTRVCDPCNSGWMNGVDLAAFPHVAEMIRGKATELDDRAQAAVAAWMCKVAVTARSEPLNPLPIEPAWTEWLYRHQSALPNWYVWIGRYEGSQPWCYNPHDVRIELLPGSAPAPDGFVRNNGVLATLVMGYLVLQVFGMDGPGALATPDREFSVLSRIWPHRAMKVAWPPPEKIGDASLDAWSQRLLHNQ